MEKRIQQMEKKVRNLVAFNAVLLLALGVMFVYGFTAKKNNTEVIRTRGIIIEDSLGRERILIGAPVPYAKNRVRTDLKRVKETWGKFFTEDYMDWYKDYNHSANGMIILDEKGFDRIAIGDPTPDPNIGKRIGPCTGIDINDQLGFERTGYGLLNVNNVNRVVLGIDGKNGTEGIYLMLSDDGIRGMGIRDAKQDIFMGRMNAAYLNKDWKGTYHGLLIKDSSAVQFNSNPQWK